MAGRLVVLDRAGRAKSKSFLLPSGMCTLGRSAACDIRVLLSSVSPHHATVTVHANQTVVRNVGSGQTLVNGEPVSVCALRHGDELALGGRRLRWEYDAPAQPRRSKTEPALALPTGVARAARRGTLAAPPRAPDRALQLALELRHRASMPACSGAGGKQVAIVQPQRRDTSNQNDSAAAAPPPARKPASARLHTPTKATLWIESRRGRARAASLRAATPLRLAVLRKALTPAAKPRAAVTKIQAPLRVDQTKQAAIMLMTGHTPKSKLSPKSLNARRTPSFVAKKRSPAARAPRRARCSSVGGDTPGKSRHSIVSPESAAPEPAAGAGKSVARPASKRSVSVLEITDSEARSPAPPSPRKSALKSGAGPRKTDSIKFDLSNLEGRASVAEDEDDVLLAPSPSPRRALHSRGGRMLASLGSALHAAASPARRSPAGPASPRSARGSALVRRALDSSSGTFVTEYSRTLEAYSVVDLVSLDSDASASASAYGSASPGARSLLGSSTPLPPRRPRPPADSPESSRQTPGRTPAKRGRLDESGPSESEDVSPDRSKKSRTSILSTSNLSNLCVPPESPRSDASCASGRSGRTAGRGSRGRLDESSNDVSPDKSRKSRATLSTSSRESSGKTISPTKRDSRGRLDVGVPESPKGGSPGKSRKSRVTTILSTSDRSTRSHPIELSQSDVSLDSSAVSLATARSAKSPKNVSPDKSRKSRATSLSTTNRSTRSLPIELSQSDVSLDSSAVSHMNSPKSVSPDRSRKSRAPLSTSAGRTRSLPFRSPRGETSPNKSRKSRATLTASNMSTLPLESSQSDVSLDSSQKSLQKTVSPKRGSRSRLDGSISKSPKIDVSPGKSRKSRATLSTSNRRTRSLPAESPRSEVRLDYSRKSQGTSKSPKDASPDKSRKSRETPSATGRSARSLVLESSQSDVSLETPKKSLGKTPSPKRTSRSRLDVSAQPGPSKDVSPDKSRKSRVTLCISNRSSRNIALESSQSETTLGSTRTSLGKTLSPKRSSRGKVDEGVSVASPEDVSPNKSTASSSPSTRRTLRLPHSSPPARRGRASPAASASPTRARKSWKSPSAKPGTAVESPKNVSAKSSRVSRKTLTFDTSVAASAAGDVTPERGAAREAGTPVLSIRTLLDASAGPLRPAPASRAAAGRRRTFAAARGSIRSKSSIGGGRDGDVTPTGAEGPSPEAVKHKHSSAKKSRSRRSIIDTLDDSGLVQHLFGSPVKRKLSQSMSEFSRRQLLEEPSPVPLAAAAGPAAGARRPPRNELSDLRGVRRLLGSPRARRSVRDGLSDVRGLKRAFARSPADDLRRVSGVRELFREDEPRDDLTDVRGVRELFGRRGPRNELVNVSGVKDGMRARSPNNDLRDVRGVKRLYRQSRAPPSPNMSGVARLLDEPAPAEALFDEPVGRPPVRATYSKTFVARSAPKPGARRRTASLGVPGDVLAARPEEWLQAELRRGAAAARKSAARALRQLATDTVAGRSPLPQARTRRSAADSYAAHTLPLKKRSLARSPRPGLPLKKRALVHSTPLKGRAARADDTLARMSPIALEPEPPEPVPELVRETPVIPASPKEKPKVRKTRTEDVGEKNESVKPSPKKTRAKRAEEAAEGRRATRGGKAAPTAGTQTPKKTVAAKKPVGTKKAPTSKRSPSPKRAPTTRRAPPSPAKSPAPRRSAAAARKPTVVARKARAVVKPAVARKTIENAERSPASSTAPPSPEPAAASRSRQPAPAAAAAAPRRRGRARPAPAAVPADTAARRRAAPEPRPQPDTRQPPAKRARRAAPEPEPAAPAPPAPRGSRAARAGAGDAPAAAVSPAPRRKTRKAPPTPVSEKKGRKAPSTPESKKRQKALPTPESKKARKAPPTPKPKRGGRPPEPKKTSEPQKGRKAPPPPEPKKTPEPKRGRRAPPTPEPKKGREAPATPEPKRGRKAPRPLAPTPEPKRGRKAPRPLTPTPEPKRGRKAPPTPAPTPEPKKVAPEPKRGRDTRQRPKNASTPAPAPAARKAPAVVAKKVHKTPEPNRSPQPKRGRRAAPPPPAAEPARRRRSPARRAGAGEPAPRAAKGKNAPPKEAPKPKGKKVVTPAVEETAPRGRKRKNDTASVEKKSEPSPKKPRAARAAAPPAAAPTRGRRR